MSCDNTDFNPINLLSAFPLSRWILKIQNSFLSLLEIQLSTYMQENTIHSWYTLTIQTRASILQLFLFSLCYAVETCKIKTIGKTVSIEP